MNHGRMRLGSPKRSNRISATARRIGPGIGLVCLAGASLGLGASSQALYTFCGVTLIYVILVVGLYVFIGNSGVMSWGHPSFMAIGAYATGLLTTPVVTKKFLINGIPGWLSGVHMGGISAAVVAVTVAAAFAAIVGMILMRLSGVSAQIATFCLLLIINVVITQSPSITGGPQTFVGTPASLHLWSIVVCAIAAIIIAWVFDKSNVALKLRAARDEEPAARACGVHVMRVRLVAFVLSACYLGFAGVLYAHFVGSFTPNDFYFNLTFLTIAMLVVGGMYSLGGAIIGTLVIASVQQILTQLENGQGLWFIHLNLPDGTPDIVIAVVMTVVLIFAPAGLLERVRGIGRRRGPHASEEPS